MFFHPKDNKLRHYLKQKAEAEDAWWFENEAGLNLDELPEVIHVFDTDKMDAILRDHERKSNLYKNHDRFLKYLDDTAGYLALSVLPTDIFAELENLRIRFPNFSGVVDYYREQFTLAELSGSRWFAANPVLIAGDPGIGKTAFCQALAKVVGTYFQLISFSGMTAGFVIGGMSSGWADGKPGKVVEALARGHNANPLIVLDEIDKVGGDKRYDPLGPLYQLLEKETAATFVDEALEITVNCQHIVWVATANYLDKIAEPILSRFAVIEVNRPGASQMARVIRSIYNKIRKSQAWGLQFSEAVPDEVMDRLVASGWEPRLVQRELIAACGKAVLRCKATGKDNQGQFLLSPEDLAISPGPKHQDQPERVMQLVATSKLASDQPLVITQWSVREVVCRDSSKTTRHLRGYDALSGRCLISGTLAAFDFKLQQVKTLSGNVFTLHGSSGSHPDVEEMWAAWKEMHSVKEDVDVSHHYGLIH